MYSGATTRVALVLAELKVPHENVHVELVKGEHKAPGYMKNQPFGQVPYLDDDGFILYESRAICRYLVTKCKSPLIPSDLKKNALFEQAASIEYSSFQPHAAEAAYEVLYKHYSGGKTDQAVVDKLVQTLDSKLAAYDVILAKQKYLAGDEITLADLFHIPIGSELEKAGIKVMFKYKNVERWWKDLISRPSWQSVKDVGKVPA